MKCEARGNAEDINFTSASWNCTADFTSKIKKVIEIRLFSFNTIFSPDSIDDTGPISLKWNSK